MAKVPCWNYCDLSVSLTIPVANLLHCSKLLPGCLVYSGLSINLPSLCSSRRLSGTLFVPTQPQGQLSLWATLKRLLSLLLQEEERGQSSPTTPNARLYYAGFQQLKQEAVVGSVKTILLIVNGWLVNPCQRDWIWNDLGDAALPVSLRTLPERFDKASWLDWDIMPNKGGRVGSSWACSLLTVIRYRTTRGLLSPAMLPAMADCIIFECDPKKSFFSNLQIFLYRLVCWNIWSPLVVQFGTALEPLGGGASLEEVCDWGGGGRLWGFVAWINFLPALCFQTADVWRDGLMVLLSGLHHHHGR